MCNFQFGLCAGSICVMCTLQLVVCAVFRWCFVQFAITTFVASLRACLASLGRAYACMNILDAGQNTTWCADLLGRTFVKATNEIPPYIHICIYICIYGCSSFLLLRKFLNTHTLSALLFVLPYMCMYKQRKLCIYICYHIYIYMYM